jgi:hypothetical protein
MSNTNESQPELSPEEILKMRERMTNHYKEQLPFLILQKDYETTLADIEEARARRMTMTLRLVQMSAPPEEEPKRKLKPE